MLPKNIFNALLKTRNFPDPDKNTWPDAWKTISFKLYERSKKYTLSKQFFEEISTKNKDILSLFKGRKSATHFAKGISCDEIMGILKIACGIKDPVTYSRPYPSAGALYPIEIYYINCDNTSEFPSGLYHFSSMRHELTQVKIVPIDDISHLLKTTQPWAKDCSGFFVLTSVLERSTSKYSFLGIRAALIEAGAIVQNIGLLSPLIDSLCRVNAGFDHERIDRFLEIDGYTENSLITMAIGKQRYIESVEKISHS